MSTYYSPSAVFQSGVGDAVDRAENVLNGKPNREATAQPSASAGVRSLFPPQEHAEHEARRRRDQATRERQEQSPHLYAGIDIGAGPKTYFSHLLLRDMCDCPQCVDTSTKQKLFSTVDVPADIQAIVRPVEPVEDDSPLAMIRGSTNAAGIVRMTWKDDIPGYGPDHETTIEIKTLRRLARETNPIVTPPLPPHSFWSAQRYKDSDLFDPVAYGAYMSDDAALYKVLLMLRTHGLLFLTGVPESEDSVSKIVERIGPLKTTFYGSTWDVRSVPQAKNVAYTAQDLGFHMDLMYMQQPPHLQFLHCIRSSSAGGASLFTDSFRAAGELWRTDRKAFAELSKLPIGFHYNHPDNYYHQSRKVIELSPTGLGNLEESVQEPESELYNERWVRHVSWAPPFQAPLSESGPNATVAKLNNLNYNVRRWHAAAQKFNTLIHDPEGIYERMMKPGECVIFDNRRILHARRAFEVGDEGKERWLRGAYMDEDPYKSKLQVLHKEFYKADSSGSNGWLFMVWSLLQPTLLQTTVFSKPPHLLTNNGILDPDGFEHDLDMALAATGYDQSHMPRFLKLVNGNSVTAFWSKVMSPSSIHGVMSERHAEHRLPTDRYRKATTISLSAFRSLIGYIVKAIWKMQVDRIMSITTEDRAAEHYVRQANSFLKRTAVTGPCVAWYRGYDDTAPSASWPVARSIFLRVSEMLRFEAFDIVYEIDEDMFAYFENGWTLEDDAKSDSDKTWYMGKPGCDVDLSVIETLKDTDTA
ncbi:hypothetical protein LTR10_005103 [Elasticomyces elasticus]|nr:hypothetical protein LTR10_005103 [Elasticomyces elasticus]KAK4975843.1 hypothetical protein LTR42_003464 [Elasticomyces elasticus]